MGHDSMLELFKEPGLGKVEQIIAPNGKGRVFFEGTYWPARWHIPTETGIAEVESWVTVLGRQGLTLLVKPNGRAVADPDAIANPMTASPVASDLDPIPSH